MEEQANQTAEPRPAPATPVWPIVLSVAIGILAGIGAYTFSYAKGLSYLSSDPRACVNCHIMQPQYDGWQKASHHTVAVCIDCHVPEGFVRKYLVKSENGWRHGKLFTTGGFVEPIVVQAAGRRILEENCIRCHDSITADMREHGVVGHEDTGGIACLHCHSSVGHGTRAGLGGPMGRAELRELERMLPPPSAPPRSSPSPTPSQRPAP